MKEQIAVDRPILDLENIRKEAKKILATRNSGAKYSNIVNTPEMYVELVNLLRARLEGTGKFTIAIDGNSGSGKSSLSRYLAWQLNLSVIETDLCRTQKTSHTTLQIPEGFIPPIGTDPELLSRLIEARHRMNRAVIVEGVFVLQSLEDARIKPNFLILIKKLGQNQSFKEIIDYRKKFHNCPVTDFELVW